MVKNYLERSSSTCKCCGIDVVIPLMDFGPQPLCNRFLADPLEVEYTHSLKLGICQRCAVVQQLVPAPADQVRPRYEWITYSEPEGHLDALVEKISQLPGIKSDSLICGITFKDDSTLARLKLRGFSRVWRLDLKEDLEIEGHGAGLETIQGRLTIEKARGVACRRGQCQILIVRHILEHAHDLHQFMSALRELVCSDGYVIFEIPDCARALKKFDYSSIWEEHVFYFTEQTFKRALGAQGFLVERFNVIPYSLENSLVAIGRFGNSQESVLVENNVSHEKEKAIVFAQNFESKKAQWREFLSGVRHTNRPVAMFGAGHSSCVFINIMGLGNLIDFIVDDNPHKINFHMPGSRLPILASSCLLEKGVKFCLLSVSPENEPKVIGKNQAYQAAGGLFGSIFPDSPYSIQEQQGHAHTAI